MRTRLVVAAVFVVVALLVGGWIVLFGSRGGEGLGRLPEADLVYPGAEPLASGSFDRVSDILGTTNAAWWQILGTDATIEEIERFYREELPSRGWGQGRADARTTSELSAVDWNTAHLRFRLSFMETEEWYQRIEGSDRFPTLYQTRIIETQPGLWP